MTTCPAMPGANWSITMRTYEVTIRAVITKTYRIETDCEGDEDEIYDDVVEQANEVFSVLNEEHVDEHYKEEIVDVTDVTGLI
jgi:hypothetical protein